MELKSNNEAVEVRTVAQVLELFKQFRKCQPSFAKGVYLIVLHFSLSLFICLENQSA